MNGRTMTEPEGFAICFDRAKRDGACRVVDRLADALADVLSDEQVRCAQYSNTLHLAACMTTSMVYAFDRMTFSDVVDTMGWVHNRVHAMVPGTVSCNIFTNEGAVVTEHLQYLVEQLLMDVSLADDGKPASEWSTP